MRKKRQRRAGRVAVAAVTGVGALLASATIAVGATAGPTPVPIDAVVPQSRGVPVEPETARPLPSVAEARRQAREERLNQGRPPVAAQLRDLEAGVGGRPEELRQRAQVVVTFRRPMPMDTFGLSRRGGGPVDLTLLPADTVVTYYAETDSGYPVHYAAPIADDAQAAVRSFLQSAMQENANANAEQPLDAATTAAAQRMAAEAGEAAVTLDERLVVLGVTLPYEAFAGVEAQLRAEVAIAAAEVDAGPGGMAFTADGQPVTPQRVREWRSAYQEGR